MNLNVQIIVVFLMNNLDNIRDISVTVNDTLLIYFLLLASTHGMEGFKALLVLFVAGIFIVGIDSGKNSVYSCT